MKFIRILLMMSLLLFVNAGAATISGYVYCDLNDNGEKDDNETCTQEAVWAKLIGPDGKTDKVTKALYNEDLNLSGYYEFNTHQGIGTFRVIIDNNANGSDTVATPPPNAHFTSDPIDGDDGNSSNGQAIYTITETNQTYSGQNYGMQFGGDCVCEDADGTVFKKTIRVDGNISDWSDVYSDPDNNICDYGCALDKDATVQSTGRNIVQFTWTGDPANLFAYGYTFRVGSSNNVQTFIYYTDRDGDGLIGDGGMGYDADGTEIGHLPDFALVARWKGTTGTTTFHFYPYIPDPEGSGADSMVWTQADLDAGKEAPGGKVPDTTWIGSGDGYTLAGSLDTAKEVEITGDNGNAQGTTETTGGLDDAGVKMEWRASWSFLNLLPFQHITYHVSSSNTAINSGHPPAGIDDNMAGCYGEAVIRYCGVTLVPNRSITLPAGSTDPVYFEHNLTNTGNGDDNLTLSLTQTGGDFSPTYIRYYNDIDGNGVFNAGDENLTGAPTIAIGLGESINLLVKVGLPAGLDNNTTVFEINATTTTCDINHSAVVTDTINISARDYDLGILKEVSDDGTTWVDDNVEVNEGEPASYRITVYNYGPDEAINVVVEDYLPVAGVTYVSHTAAAGTDYNNTTGLWTIGTLADGAERELIIDVTANLNAGLIAPGKVYQNIACTSDTNVTVGEYPDCDDANITIIHKPIVNLQITKVVSDPAPYEGDDINYTIIVTNFGPDEAINVEVNDTLPSHVTPTGDYNASTGTVGSGPNWIWDIGTMASGDVETLIFTVNVDSNATANNPQTNTVCVTTDTNDTDPSDDCASSTFNATNIVDVGVVKTVNIPYPGEGDTIVYTINVTNYGPINVTNLIIEDVLPSGVTYVSHIAAAGTTYGAGSWDIGDLNVSDLVALTITATVDNGTARSTISNVASIDSLDQNDTNGTNDSDYATIIVENPSIDIEKFTNDINVTDARGPEVNTGDIITWTYVVTNTGDTNLSNIIVSDNKLQAGDIDCQYTTLAIDANMTCTATGTAIVGQYENNGTVTAISPTGASVTDSDLSYYFATDVPVSIGDFAWYDDNDNGFQDSGEVPVNGLTVELLDVNGTPIGNTLTDANGAYLFDNLTPGTYSVVFSGLTDEYVFSTRQENSVAYSDGSTDQIILASGENNFTIDVGLYCITPKEGSSSGGDAMGNISAALMVLMTLMIGLFFVRREELLNRNKI